MVRRVNTISNQYGAARLEYPANWDDFCPVLQKARGIAESASICRWRPADELFDQLPDGFELKFYCLKGRDSVRRFLPVNGSDQLIADLFLGGLAVLNRHQQLSDQQLWSYRMMLIFFQKTRSLNNHYKRNFAGFLDLIINKPGRESGDKRNILPDDLVFLDKLTGKEFPGGTTKLQSEGERLAKEHGILKPNRQQIINYGLFAAAMNQPLKLKDPEQIELCVRMSLFNNRNTKICDPETRHWIEEQILIAIEKHQHDSQEKFDNWFSGPRNSFLSQISKKKCPFGKLDNDTVRWVLLEWGWDAYHYVGNCIDAQMRCLKNALPAPLDARERKIFEMVYLKQDYLGEFPLLLLQERLSFLQIPMLAVLNGQEDFDFAGTIHRLLLNYSSMAESRRAADRRIQDFSFQCGKQKRMIKIFEYKDDQPVEDSGNRRRYKPLTDDEEDNWND